MDFSAVVAAELALPVDVRRIKFKIGEASFAATKDNMIKKTAVKCLFVDIGGVLLTDGWSREAAKMAAKTFNLDFDEIENRHKEALDTYELGKLSLKEYLKRLVFYKKRPFTEAQFLKFMYAQSKPYPKMIELMRWLKAQYGLKIVVLSNEGREINEYRISKFKLDTFVDYFVSSCFVHLRKPDTDIFRLALDTARVAPGQVIYIENTPMFVESAKELGIRSILHTDCASTRAKLASFGLEVTGNQ
jgi:putative hydrolase of the HAD superfamily